MSRNFKWLLLLILLLPGACNEMQQSEFPDIPDHTENFVSLDEVSGILSEISVSQQLTGPNESTKADLFARKKIKEITPVYEDSGIAAYYIINYTGGGFIVLSADKRTMPVLAFSDSGSFRADISLNGFKYALGEWMEETKNLIGRVRSLNIKQEENVEETWRTERIIYFISKKLTDNPAITKGYPTDPDPDMHCGFKDEEIGPLTKVRWHQWDGYNYYINYYCSNSPNGKAPVGCVAVALGQLMKHYKYPKSYPWESIPDKEGGIVTSMLMSDICSAVKMEYGCDGSGATMENATSALLNTFGFATAVLADYNSSTVERFLKLGRPVILSGGTKSGGKYTNGHCWVCDGVRRFAGHVIDKDGRHSGCGSYLYFYMNWGWGETNNGWFGFNNWNPGNNSYNYKRRMIYDIYPI